MKICIVCSKSKDFDSFYLSWNWSKTKKIRVNSCRARDRLDYAVNKGHILKEPCIVCGSIKSEGHHEDYTKPLEVIWLCSKHHAEKHNKENMGVEATIV